MMNMKYIYNIMYRAALALAAILALASCIRDEIALCPPLHVNIAVKDKNYFNIDGAERLGYEERLAEDLPFNRYVSTLYYILHDAATGAVVQEQTVQQVTSGDRTISVSFPDDLPFGSYIITVWGNLQSERPLGDNPTASDLHLYNAEATTSTSSLIRSSTTSIPTTTLSSWSASRASSSSAPRTCRTISTSRPRTSPMSLPTLPAASPTARRRWCTPIRSGKSRMKS